MISHHIIFFIILLIRKTINGFLQNFVESFEEAEKISKKRNNFLIRLCFFSWFKMMPRLREKKMVVESKYEKIIEQFRFVS